MATKCIIGIKRESGTVDSIICWSDGYPDHMGPVLTENYETPEKAEAMLAGGDLNFLDTTLAKSIYEHRDRKADWEKCKPQTYNNVGSFLRSSFDFDYAYIFMDGQWNYFNPNES